MKSDQKAEFYKQKDTVAEYDRLRFGRGGGPIVAEKETAAIRKLVQDTGLSGKALDCPSGTGRFIETLKSCGFEVTASDVSETMIEASKSFGAKEYLVASADELPLTDASHDLWLMSRFCFHFEDPLRFIREAHRVLKPGGCLIFDAYHWTPRGWIPGKIDFWGGRTFTHSRAKVRSWADESGFELVAEKPIFLVAPYIYGYLPASIVRGMEAVSDSLLPRLTTKSYYVFRKTGNTKR